MRMRRRRRRAVSRAPPPAEVRARVPVVERVPRVGKLALARPWASRVVRVTGEPVAALARLTTRARPRPSRHQRLGVVERQRLGSLVAQRAVGVVLLLLLMLLLLLSRRRDAVVAERRAERWGAGHLKTWVIPVRRRVALVQVVVTLGGGGRVKVGGGQVRVVGARQEEDGVGVAEGRHKVSSSILLPTIPFWRSLPETAEGIR